MSDEIDTQMNTENGKPSEVVYSPSISSVVVIGLLRRQVEKGKRLVGYRPLSAAEYDAWENITREYLVKAFGPDSKHVDSIMNVGKLGSVPASAGEGWWENHRAESLEHQLIMLRGAIEQLEMQSEFEKHGLGPKHDGSLSVIGQLCSRFHLVTCQLRARYDNRPTLDVGDEYDVQDLLHALLRLFFDDIRPEEWTPSYAGKSSRMDFLLKEDSVVIEVKKTRSGLSAPEVGSQLIDDIARYREHPDCRTLICFVYDPEGRIANPHGIERDLSRQEGDMMVMVKIVPKGY